MNGIQIISGGQTGVDQGALDAALAVGVAHGGWCPQGGRCETGQIPKRFRLREMDSPDYPARTRKNVEESHRTLILAVTGLTGGTLLTHELATSLEKPVLVVDPAEPENVGQVRTWLTENGVTLLNVAGPRESESPGIQQLAKEFVETLLRSLT